MTKKKTNIKVTEHSGEEHETEVENFNATELYQQVKAAQSNDSNDYVVVIGEVIIDARSIKSVTPIK